MPTMSCLLLATLVFATSAAGIEQNQPGEVFACLFHASDRPCFARDWNDDGALSAADLTAYLTFTPLAADEVRINDGPAAVVLRSAAAFVRVDKETAEVGLGSAAGTGLTRVQAPTLQINGTAWPPRNIRNVRVLPRGISLTADSGPITVEWVAQFLPGTASALRTSIRPADPNAVARAVTTLEASPGERFYGLTERIVDDRSQSEIIPQAVGTLDRRGEIVHMTVTPTMSLYTPFFHSSRGYGVFVQGTMTGVYDLAKTDPEAVTIDFELNQRTGGHAVVYFFGDYDAVLDQYTALTGRPFLPPRWAFRHLRWRDEHRIAPPARLDGFDMNADLVDDVTMYENLGIPPGNYEFDRPWTSGSASAGHEGFASFDFDPVRFPNAAEMLQALRNRGYHVFVFGAPWAVGDNAVEATADGYYVPRSDLLIDFTNPGAVAWWTERVQSLIDLGISGMKLDRSEFDISELPIVPDQPSDVFADGRNGREMINGYTVDYARVHYDAFADRLGTDFVHYVRAGYAGSQQYGIFWGGDTPGRGAFGILPPTDLGLRSAIQSLAHVAFLGFPIWGTDTGGYYQFGQRDVFARWLEFSAFCPFMEIGGGNQGGGQHAPWDMPTDPHDDPAMIDIYRRYVALHHELIPLLYSLASEAHDSGRPLARPLAFDFPDDPAVGDLWDEFLLGRDLLFAPLWRDGDRSRDVYLPAGTWIDYWEPARQLNGPTTITADAPLDRIPLYVRAGGILPLSVSSSITGNGSEALSSSRLTLDLYPSGASSLTLHEETGDSVFTLAGQPCEGGTCVELDITAPPRSYVARVLTDNVRGVTLDGEVLEPAGSFAALELAESGWYADGVNERVWVKFATNTSAARLQLQH